ncbi:TPA: LPXTG cell wall anchor domain-containing protein, partial [Enterococcus faecalis]|nr:LPXTG cell wall anchor domain-containing protein [Enterococcus faecalis]
TATQAEVDQAEAKLRSAVKQLVKVPTKEVDKTNLLKIIKENEKNQEKDYTASSWKVYSEALKQAQTVVDQATATQAEVDQAEAELGSAVKQLVKVPTIDKTNLLKIIKENEKNQEKDYTASSWKVYSEALQQAQTVADQTTATQAEVDQAEEKLRSAVKQLVKVPTKEVDKTNLLKIIKENEKHQEKDYTASSWKVYSEALQQAKTVADQTTATQAEVDQAEAKLRSAVKQLTLKNSGENKKEQKNGGNNGHLNTSAGVDQTSTKQVKPSSQGGFRKASQFLPSTGEKKSIALVIIGLLVIASGCLLVFRKSKSKK